ncbi:MAG TPA: N-acetyl-D-Glu racemase DgcA [Phenylobacterium sp.]|nr:N-acetyl-D-Glu racemase DgcA [Phenylobacterium sp.]
MSLELAYRTERLALRAPFRISRGVKTHAEVVVAQLGDAGALGFGECVPYRRYGETVTSVSGQLAEAAGRLARGEPVRAVLAGLPAGAARNALDCALWDLEARRDGWSVAERLGRALPPSMPTAVTISLDTPQAMGAAAKAAAGSPLLKVKLDETEPAARLAAVAAAAPEARLILDPNESWTPQILAAMAEPVSRLDVAMVEQPLPAEADAALEGLAFPAPICADEAVHTRADLPAAAARYQMVNVKLDKAGGLTEALAMAEAARAMGLGVLAGCMVSSSLSIAPALWVGAMADACDLDGPWWVAQDRRGGCRIEHGVLYRPQAGFWGEPAPRP